jgi:putative transposase
LGGVIEQNDTRSYALAFIPNHFHLLQKTGRIAIATVMRRLLKKAKDLSWRITIDQRKA